MKGTVAIEEAIIDPAGVEAHSFAQFQSLMQPGSNAASGLSAHEHRLLDIHGERLKSMDEHGVEYMLLSLTSPGAQGETDPDKARSLARVANDYLAAEVQKNPKRFGAVAALSMHSAKDAAEELRRAVKDLGMFGAMINDFQSKGANAKEKVYFDTPDYDPFWQTVQELDVPIYFHPRYAIPQDLEPRTKYGDRKHLLGAGVQFHLDLSWHLYAICSSGVFDRFPKVQIVAGHLGEGSVDQLRLAVLLLIEKQNTVQLMESQPLDQSSIQERCASHEARLHVLLDAQCFDHNVGRLQYERFEVLYRRIATRSMHVRNW
jgi:2,3-dihydroxybenzoate decarboxylase